MAAVKKLPVTCALTTDGAPVDWRTDPFGWGRFNVYQWDTATTLTAKLKGCYGWAPKLQERLSLAVPGQETCASGNGQGFKGVWAKMNLIRYLPRFQKGVGCASVMAERETWPRSAIEAFQLDRLNAVWQHAAVHVPYYRGLRTNADLPLRFSSLSEFRSSVPVLSKSEIRTTPQRFFSEQPRRGGWKRTADPRALR